MARFNGLPVFTERTPSPPHLPFGTLEVVVDEVLFLEHLTSRWLKASQGPKQEGTNQHARSWVLGFCCEKKRDQQKCHHLQMRDELMSWKRTMASWKNGSWMYPLVNWDSWLETGPFDLKMYFLLKIVIFQPAMLVYQRVVGKKARNIQELLVFFEKNIGPKFITLIHLQPTMLVYQRVVGKLVFPFKASLGEGPWAPPLNNSSNATDSGHLLPVPLNDLPSQVQVERVGLIPYWWLNVLNIFSKHHPKNRGF